MYLNPEFDIVNLAYISNKYFLVLSCVVFMILKYLSCERTSISLQYVAVKGNFASFSHNYFFSDDLVSLLRLRINMTAMAPPESCVEQQTRESNGVVHQNKILSLSFSLSRLEPVESGARNIEYMR